MDISSYDRWHRSAFNLCRVIVVHDGPDALGRTYVDGRHEHEIAVYDTPEEAEEACRRHNEGPKPSEIARRNPEPPVWLD